jgi:hypothetical protein
MVSAPHGPETGNDHVHLSASRPAADEEARVFHNLLYPDDSYTAEGVYWADLPFFQQIKFNGDVDNAEARKELGSIWSMIKKDPLSPIGWYFRNAVLPGAGLGLEGYAISKLGFSLPLTFSEDTSFSPLVT